jgi:type VI secretion system protein ImpK
MDGGVPRASASAALVRSRTGVNNLVDSAASLFDLVIYLRGQAAPLNIDQLRSKTLALLDEFKAKAAAARNEQAVIDAAHYSICATIDDAILSTPWGFDSDYVRSPLVISDQGGAGFFDGLEKVQKQPERLRTLLEFMYVCLSLGFQGRMRREHSGDVELEQHRQEVFQQLVRVRDGIEMSLSPQWEGVLTERRRAGAFVPLWLVATLGVAATLALYVFFYIAVGESGRSLEAKATSMPVQGEVEIIEFERAVAVELEPESLPTTFVSETVCGALGDLLAFGVIECDPHRGSVRVRFLSEAKSTAMFASGKAVLTDTYANAIRDVARALNSQQGAILVVGHTDATPLRRNHPYRSNLELSVARAEAVGGLLEKDLDDKGRVEIEGVGARDLLVQNANNAKSNARNRRVELFLVSPAAAR